MQKNIKQLYKLLFVGLMLLILVNCQKQEENKYPTLGYVSFTPLSIPEASGMAIYKDGTFLSVSDSTSQAYVFSMEGIVLKTLVYVGKDLEGVVYIPGDEIIFVLEENSDEVVQLDTNGLEQGRFKVPLEKENPKHGLEGISYNPENKHLYVISEKLPARLFELSLDGELLHEYDLNFAEDYSSVFYDPIIDRLWILSDDSETLTRTTLTGAPEITYDTRVKKGEGLVVDSESSRVYIITDTNSAVYELSF